MKSMTGYGQSTTNLLEGVLEISLSSVNHRYQDISLKLSKELLYLEQEILRNLRQKTFRGKLLVRVSFSRNVASETVPMDERLFEEYLLRLRKIEKKYSMEHGIGFDTILGLPGVLEKNLTFTQEETLELQRTVVTEIENAFMAWDSMRCQEGKHLQKILLQYLEETEIFLEKIEELWKKERKEAVSSIKTRLSSFVESVISLESFDESRIFQEAAILMEKQDIAEEICRFRSHAEKLKGLLEISQPQGRKVEFLLQEINREINTIASKSNHKDLRWFVVEIKSLLERMREQIQNVE